MESHVEQEIRLIQRRTSLKNNFEKRRISEKTGD